MIPYCLPHDLAESDFTDERSLSEWMELWFGGFSEREVDDLYQEAEVLVMGILHLEFGQALCDVEGRLSAEQRYSIWRNLIGLGA